MYTCFELGQLTARRVSLTLETVSYQVHQYQTSASDEEKSRHTLLGTFESVTFFDILENEKLTHGIR